MGPERARRWELPLVIAGLVLLFGLPAALIWRIAWNVMHPRPVPPAPPLVRQGLRITAWYPPENAGWPTGLRVLDGPGLGLSFVDLTAEGSGQDETGLLLLKLNGNADLELDQTLAWPAGARSLLPTTRGDLLCSWGGPGGAPADDMLDLGWRAQPAGDPRNSYRYSVPSPQEPAVNLGVLPVNDTELLYFDSGPRADGRLLIQRQQPGQPERLVTALTDALAAGPGWTGGQQSICVLMQNGRILAYDRQSGRLAHRPELDTQAQAALAGAGAPARIAVAGELLAVLDEGGAWRKFLRR